MSIEMIDFDDLPEEEVTGVSTVNVTAKVELDVRDMFAKIAKRERYNSSSLAGKLIKEYTENYIKQYKEETK